MAGQKNFRSARKEGDLFMSSTQTYASGVGLLNCDLLFSGLDRLPVEGEELYARGFDLQLGGGLPATMIHLARLGVPVDFSTFLGQGQISTWIGQALEASGAVWRNLYHGTGEPVTVTSVLILPSDRTFVSRCESIVYTDEMKQALLEQFRGARILRMGLELLDVYRQLKAERPDILLVLDESWREDLSLSRYGDYLSLADYYTPNQQEAALITGESSPERALESLRPYLAHPLVKLGAQGCLLWEEGAPVTVPADRLTSPAVDATGAGDAFIAGLMYGLYHRRPLRECIALGNVMGAVCVQHVGCLTGRITPEELERRAAAILARMNEQGGTHP